MLGVGPTTRRSSFQKECVPYTAGRPRLQLLAIVVLTLGSIAIVLEGASIGVVRHGVDMVQTAWRHVSQVSAEDVVELVFQNPTERMCYATRDVGLFREIHNARQVFCKAPKNDADRRTEVSLIDLNPSGLNLRAMVFKRDLELDFTTTSIARPIESIAQDGGNHDPRFLWTSSMISCGCNELETFAAETLAQSNTTLRLWEPHLIDTPETYDEASTVCGSPRSDPSASTLQIQEKTILIARRDDHNPFFQISNALNAWLVMKSLGWRREETRIIHMDGGYESHIDELHHRLLSSPAKWEILRGQQDLLGRRFQFTNEVIMAPHEATGPMMAHLNSVEPCYHSQLFQTFRTEALHALGIHELSRDKTHITVTIISRRNYSGRRVQRLWLNEDEVVEAMRQQYPSIHGIPIVIQSIDFVQLSLEQQMQVALQSDVIIGMHGAGMVNVMWTKPETLVIEIFPKRRYRWGYRNLCQFLGCEWHEFRDGVDTGRGDNRSDKTIPVETWTEFFDPLFQEHLSKLVVGEQHQVVEQRRLRQD